MSRERRRDAHPIEVEAAEAVNEHDGRPVASVVCITEGDAYIDGTELHDEAP